ncbi:RNA methyltransferase [Candidatus Campbellbacteria bacterium CG10_big_fil_rev_8_21_14_0_10_35_52]|uniref:RNA methyltransferase n=1 Tax=Candidatus Campbellbacteria bacterium CG10_big_fil_rev_8_21_14_0_10_35_52 TaxID=1974527 RepID=A0A2M6WV20_9BACT|nr:MAG: RNA methyltransferase [Candidatus Campbellbacteria bacterium CG10_big_fil_rev_8_21_14_0_10_35_52]
MTKNPVYLILHNIRSVQNVGAIFRTADASGISKIYLTGYTPTPIDRFGRARKDFAKTALGAQNTVAWESVSSINLLIKRLKKEEIKIIAIEQSKNAIDYKKIKIKFPSAFIFGNEVKGLSKSILKKSDKIAYIKMLGRKESLNVSVAIGIFIFRVLKI